MTSPRRRSQALPAFTPLSASSYPRQSYQRDKSLSAPSSGSSTPTSARPQASRRRSQSYGNLVQGPFLYTPSTPPTLAPVTPPPRSSSYPKVHCGDRQYYWPGIPSMTLENDDDAYPSDEGPGLVFGRGEGNGFVLRPRRAIQTGHGTETEDEPGRNLPTSRKVPPSEHHSLNIVDRLLPYIAQFCRLLSIFPALAGSIQHGKYIWDPLANSSSNHNTRIDWFVALIWSLLTGWQCFHMTSGLLSRWMAYYAQRSIVVRLIGLQSICWPATYYTVLFFKYDGHERPVPCWAVIATTTCISRSIQIYVTSNLVELEAGQIRQRPGGRWAARKWDWSEVMVKCVLPAGVGYFLMAWAGVFARELAGC